MSSRTGKYGENIAFDYLSKKGFDILETNHRNPGGEIDIIAQKGSILYLVEVKTRRNIKFGLPEEYVSENKLARIKRAGLLYKQQKKESVPKMLQVLVVSILLPKIGPKKIKVIEVGS